MPSMKSKLGPVKDGRPGVEHFVVALRVFNATERRRAMISEPMRRVGECVYVIRTKDDLIKIGWTRNLHERMRRLGVTGANITNLLAVFPGTESTEHELHLRFHRSLARGKEYFHPTPDLVEWINERRDAMGVPALDVA